MIRLADATLLASTKLRSRPFRTTLTVLLGCLLFGVLVAASLIMTGAFASIDSFRKDGLTGRYIVNVHKPISGNTMQLILRDPTVIAEAKKRYSELVEAKATEAKRLGLTYNQATDMPPYLLLSDGKTEALSVNDPNGIVQKILAEKYSDSVSFDDVQLEHLATEYSATRIFTSEAYEIARGSSLTTLKDGKEVFYDQSDEAEMNANYTKPLVDSTQMTIAPSEITAPFILSDNAGWKPDGNSLPIILPQNIVEQLLGFEKLSDKATATEKLERIKIVRERAVSLSFQACYRNSSSNNLIQTVLRQQKDIKAHENDDDYQMPSTTYALPDPTKCENPTIVSDTRTTDEKHKDDNQRLFDKKFSEYVEPTSYFVSFKVVGISPVEVASNGPETNQSSSQIRNLDDVITNLLRTSGIGQVIPREIYEQLPDKTKYSDIFTYNPLYLFGNEDNKIRYVEFANVHDAEKFIDEQSCTTQYDNTCKPIGRPYQASLAFSNSAALDDIRTKTTYWFEYAIVGAMILAAFIMWITISRAIADGRHESAVFRAIGFKRIDIAMIYILYTFTLSIFVTIFAGGLGVLSAYIANLKLAPVLTAQAQYGFGGIDLSKQVTLMGVDLQQLGILAIACLVTGLLGMIIPLARNVRRSPIRDLREE